MDNAYGVKQRKRVRKATKTRTRTRAASASPARGGQFDYTTFFVVIILMLFGIVMIFSSSYYYTMTKAAYNYDMYYFLKRQLVWAVIGTCALIVCMNINYRIYRSLATGLYAMSNFFLILVLIVGKELNGSKRWLGVTDTLGFQPSELAKIAVIIYLAYYISKNRESLGTFKGFMKCFMLLVVPVALIGAANLSTALVVMFIGLAMMFIGSPKIRYFLFIIIPVGAIGSAALFMEQFAYRLDRIRIWRDPFSDPTDLGFQTIQSLYAVASGGLFGLGLGQSRQKTFIPEAYNDIIFAIICEELGLVGAILVILLFVVLFWRGIRTAINSKDLFGCLIAAGIVAMVGVQFLINVSVVTNTIPNTGMPLPFISYGGSSLLFTMASMGILLNISKFQKRTE